MEALAMIGQFILGLSILITLHEFGHFIAARAFGMRVEKFYLFFDAWGVKLFKFKKGETEYGIGWLPFGGYVKISGMIDESMDKEAMDSEAKDYEFRSIPAWQRLIVMVAGVFLNIILGFVIFIGITYTWGETYIPNENLKNGIAAQSIAEKIGFQDGDKILKINGDEVNKFREIYGAKVLLEDNPTVTVLRNGNQVKLDIPPNLADELAEGNVQDFIVPRVRFAVDSVMEESPAADAGLQKGDSIVAIDNSKIAYFDQLSDVLNKSAGESVSLTIKRDGESINKTVEIGEDGKLGFFPSQELLEIATEYYSFGEAIVRGSQRTITTLSDYVKGLKKLFSGDVDPSKSVQGPISIAKNIYGGIWIWERFWQMTGILSLVIGIMNILPIPALDGGHVLMITIEIIRGKPLNDKIQGVVQTVGMVFLLSLMVLIVFNDIWRNFF